jgi:hypothetical protein
VQTTPWHRFDWQTPPVQIPLAQSVLVKQLRPFAHFGHGPPQSTSVSAPFLTPSVHDAAWHLPALQTRLWQSLPTEQFFPLLQGVQLPPQSTSDSVPFLIPSVHVGRVTHVLPWQICLLLQQLNVCPVAPHNDAVDGQLRQVVRQAWNALGAV